MEFNGTLFETSALRWSQHKQVWLLDTDATVPLNQILLHFFEERRELTKPFSGRMVCYGRLGATF